MKTISAAFQAHLDGEVVNHCFCWLLFPTTGSPMGFTDHDQDIELNGILCRAGSGLQASKVEQTLGLNVDNQEVAGALQDIAINDSQIEAGYFDNAVVEQYLVNWSDPAQRLMESRHVVGEVVRADGHFKVELRSISSFLDQSLGHHFVRHCQVDLGSAQCGVDLTSTDYSTDGVVDRIHDALNLEVTLAGMLKNSVFRGGLVQWSTGVNAGAKVEVADYSFRDNISRIQLWKPMPVPPEIGDLFSISVGCDKQFSTCRDTFQNQLNFRGFPHLPGDDFASSYAGNSSRMDGGVLIK